VLAGGLIIALFAGTGIALAIVIIALKGTRHIAPAYILTSGIFGGSTLAAFVTILVKKLVRAVRGRGGNGTP
jgi:hypothetical protein